MYGKLRKIWLNLCYLTSVKIDLCLRLDHASVAHGQTVQQVHHDDHDEKDENEEEHISHGRLERQVGKLELAHKHGEGLDDSKSEKVEKSAINISLKLVGLGKRIF
jgi:hypothetical protein